MIQRLFRCLLLAFAVVTAGGEAWAKNWNSNGSSEVEVMGKSLKFKYPPNYRATFICNGTGGFNDANSKFQVSENLISITESVFGGSGDTRFEYNRNSARLTMNGESLPSSMMINGMKASDLGNVIKPYDRPRFLFDGRVVTIGQKFKETDVKFFSGPVRLSGSIEFQLRAFEKYKNISVASGDYVIRFSGKVNGQNVTVVSRGHSKYHLGSGFIVQNKVNSMRVTNAGQSNEAGKGVLECSLVGEEQLHKDVRVALGWEGTTSGSSLATNQNSFQADAAEEMLALERRKRQTLEQQLAALKAQQEQRQQTIAADTQKPTITASASSNGTDGIISGTVRDNVEVAEVLVNGQVVVPNANGSFKTQLYIPRAGKTVEIVAVDTKGNKATKSLFLDRGAVQGATGPVFASLNPSGKRVRANKDALALIIGVADYERTPAKAAYADKDAKTFYDYAMLKLGIPAGNIKELVNVDANRIDVSLAIKDWIARTTKQGSSDIYVFFAGHGLASQSGEQMYLLPYDGSPRLLEDSAISRERLFSDISAANPRSVTVFLDTCYSGTTRGTDMLIASRPIAIRALEQSVPDNFTVMTAAAGDQTAKPLEEAKHGMFSYFLMKGMEGDADSNQDNQITAGELHQYVQQNVVQQSSGSQTPELQGDANRVLVRFQ